jgi:hypothetical protein
MKKLRLTKYNLVINKRQSSNYTMVPSLFMLSCGSCQHVLLAILLCWRFRLRNNFHL